MSDTPDPAPPEEEGPFPWDDPQNHPQDEEAPRERYDAFTEARKSDYLRVLVKTGCILDACRKTGVSPRTVYRHQESDPSFFEHCRVALRMSGAPAEITAWQRAVEGVEQEFACGGQVHVRRRYSDGLLRLLLQGSNPKKYGARPGFRRKQLLKHERKQMEREIRAEIAAKQPTFDDAMELLQKRLERMDEDGLYAHYLPGWTKTPDGHWIPPGYAPIPGYVAPAAEREEEEAVPLGPSTPRDSM